MKAPSFSLSDSEGKVHSLSDYKGKWLIIYFYPRDNTPGCTKEACSFRDTVKDFAKLGVSIIGISKDSVSSHKKFSTKYKLSFPLLSDTSTDVIKAFGSWGKKKFMGKEFEGTLRNTYLINPQQEIVKVYEKVDPVIHIGAILKDLKSLQ